MHIFQHDQHRENQSIQTLLTGVGVPPGPDWLQHLGWNPANCWFAFNIPTQLVLKFPPATAPGDIDVMGGPLESPDGAWDANLLWELEVKALNILNKTHPVYSRIIDSSICPPRPNTSVI